MSPWPGMEVEAGKRGGIKEVFGGRASRPISRSRAMLIFRPCSCDGLAKVVDLAVVQLKITTISLRNTVSSSSAISLSRCCTPYPPAAPSPMQPFLHLNHHQNADSPKMSPSPMKPLPHLNHQNAGLPRCHHPPFSEVSSKCRYRTYSPTSENVIVKLIEFESPYQGY